MIRPLRWIFEVDGFARSADINNMNLRPSSSGDEREWHGQGGRRALMDFKNKYTLPEHLQDGKGLPRSQQERLLLIKRRVEQGFYDSEHVKQAVAEAFLDPPFFRRAGEQAYPSSEGGS